MVNGLLSYQSSFFHFLCEGFFFLKIVTNDRINEVDSRWKPSFFLLRPAVCSVQTSDRKDFLGTYCTPILILCFSVFVFLYPLRFALFLPERLVFWKRFDSWYPGFKGFFFLIQPGCKLRYVQPTSFTQPNNCFFPSFSCYRVHEFEVRINERQKHVYLFNIKSKIAILFVRSRNYRGEKKAQKARGTEMKNNWNEFIERFLPFILFPSYFHGWGCMRNLFLGDSCLITRRAFYFFAFLSVFSIMGSLSFHFIIFIYVLFILFYQN